MNQDKIFKFSDFLTENVHDTPETYVDNALFQIRE
jgi:hypothetical protein